MIKGFCWRALPAKLPLDRSPRQTPICSHLFPNGSVKGISQANVGAPGFSNLWSSPCPRQIRAGLDPHR
jgi:hypothetical protein